MIDEPLAHNNAERIAEVAGSGRGASDAGARRVRVFSFLPIFGEHPDIERLIDQKASIMIDARGRAAEFAKPELRDRKWK